MTTEAEIGRFPYAHIALRANYGLAAKKEVTKAMKSVTTSSKGEN